MIGGKQQKGDPENPGFGEHFHKHPLEPSSFGTDPIDGLPRPASVATLSVTRSPPITKDVFICMGDFSVFVVRDDQGAVKRAFEPSQVVRLPNGKWCLQRDAITPEERTDLLRGDLFASRSVVVYVEPIRPQCRNYRRTLIDMPANPEHQYLERVCMAARDENGQFVTINDTRVYACELREPRHLESESKLDEIDEKATAKAREETSEFDIDAALDAEGGRGGILE